MHRKRLTGESDESKEVVQQFTGVGQQFTKWGGVGNSSQGGGEEAKQFLSWWEGGGGDNSSQGGGCRQQFASGRWRG